jgi:hypothetical protein
MSIQSNFPAIKPTLLLDFANVEQLDPRITFSRASTATYYGTQTAKAEENLHIRSQEFDNAAWTKGEVSVTADNLAAPDGTTTAELMAETSATAVHILSGNASNNRPAVVSGQVYAFSVFLKKGTGATAPDIVQFSWGGAGFSSAAYVNFNLSTGAIETTGADASNATITSVGNSWYRCSFTATATSSTTSSIGVIFCNNNGAATRAPSYAGATTADVFLWGAQLEQRSVVTAYTATTTQPITNYIPQLLTAASGVARFDHNPTTFESLGLEIEEQRTNLVTYSEQFNDAAWTKTRSSITADATTSPDGTVDADKLVEDTTATSTHFITQSFNGTTGTIYTATLYAKAAERNFVRITLPSAIFGVATTWAFDLTTGATSPIAGTSGTTATSEAVGNGWWRIRVTSIAATATTSGNFQITISETSTNATYTGDGYSGIYIWGAQLEAGAFATSYIPTVASQVTRAADAASMTGANFSSWFNNAEGTLYADYLLSDPNSHSVAEISSGGSDYIRMRYSSGGAAQYTVQVAGVTQANQAPTGFSTPNTQYKRAITYATNSFNQAINGLLPTAEDTSGTVPVSSRLFIGAEGATGSVSQLGGTIKKLAYYPVRVTNAQLQGLTS